MNKNHVVIALADGIIPIAWSQPLTEESANRAATDYNSRQSNGYTTYQVWTVEKLKSRVNNPFKDE